MDSLSESCENLESGFTLSKGVDSYVQIWMSVLSSPEIRRVHTYKVKSSGHFKTDVIEDFVI